MKNLFFVFFILNALALSAPAGAGEPQKTAALVNHGRELFSTNCAVCHGNQGKGDGPAGMAMSPRPRNFISDTFKNGSKPENIFETITHGLAGSAMAAFNSISEPDRWALAFYVAGLHEKGGKE